MTVKKLTQEQKDSICGYVRSGIYEYNTMATAFGVSRRTIIRAVEEAGLDPKIHRRKKSPEPLTVEQQQLEFMQEKEINWFPRQFDRLVRWWAGI